MGDKCVKCKKVIEDGEGRFNYPDGVRCGDCGVNYTGWKKKSKPKPVSIMQEFDESLKLGVTTIGSYIIPNTLLYDYAEKVRYLRHSTIMSIGREDPIFVHRALTLREEIHRKIFQHVGLAYHADKNATKESIEFNQLLDEWVSERCNV